eukprot:TRINITY_DN4761_c0_g1_i2.p1 TRINITY_DN4761_c0_g1~~TRINITY_DN4761_c0_g1_i2.p1  ORF type:complete len:457 (+),score=131.87 TRINITY_DN4761_c0_g1_i2:79-1371(+)
MAEGWPPLTPAEVAVDVGEGSEEAPATGSTRAASERSDDVCGDCFRVRSEWRMCPETGRPHRGHPPSRRRSSASSGRRRSSQLSVDSTPGRPSQAWAADPSDSSGGLYSAGSAGRKSLATRAFEQILANRAAQEELELGIRQVARDNTDLAEFADRRGSWVASGAFRLQKFQLECMNALAAKKAAGKLVGKVRARKVARPQERRRHKLESRSVLRKGAMTPKYVVAQELSKLQGSAAVALLRQLPRDGSAAPATGSCRPMPARPKSAPPRRPAEAAGRGGNPGETLLEVEKRLDAAAVRQTDPLGVLVGGSRTGRASFDDGTLSPASKARWAASAPTYQAHAVKSPPTVGVLRSPVSDVLSTDSVAGADSPDVHPLTITHGKADWSNMLARQDSQMAKLHSSDVTYRKMLRTFEDYQAEVQRRLDVLLAM